MEILVYILKGALLFVSVIMTFFILLQEGKGGGLAALGGTKGASVEGVTNPIRRATAYLAIIFFIIAIMLGYLARNPASKLGNEGLGEDKAAIGPEAQKTGPAEAQLPALAPDVKKDPGLVKTEEKPVGASKTEEAKSASAKPEDVKKSEPAPAAKTGEEKSAPAKAEDAKSAPAKSDELKSGEAKTAPAPAPESKSEPAPAAK